MKFQPNVILLGVFSGVLNIGIAMSVVTISANLEHRSGPASSVAGLGQFLLTHPSADYRGTAMRQDIWRRHRDQITYWRIVDSDDGAIDLNSEIAKARRSFADECDKLQGDVSRADRRAFIQAVSADNDEPIGGQKIYPDTCIGGKGRALGALYAYPLDRKPLLGSGAQALAAFFVMTGAAIDGSITSASAAARARKTSKVTSAKSESGASNEH